MANGSFGFTSFRGPTKETKRNYIKQISEFALGNATPFGADRKVTQQRLINSKDSDAIIKTSKCILEAIITGEYMKKLEKIDDYLPKGTENELATRLRCLQTPRLFRSAYTKSTIELATIMFMAIKIRSSRSVNPIHELKNSIKSGAFILELERYLQEIAPKLRLPKGFSNKVCFEGPYIKVNKHILNINDFGGAVYKLDVEAVKNCTLRKVFDTNDEINKAKYESNQYFNRIRGNLVDTVPDSRERNDLIVQIITFKKLVSVSQRKLSNSEITYSDLLEIGKPIFQKLQLTTPEKKSEFINHLIIQGFRRNNGLWLKRALIPTIVFGTAFSLVALPIATSTAIIAGAVEAATVAIISTISGLANYIINYPS